LWWNRAKSHELEEPADDDPEDKLGPRTLAQTGERQPVRCAEETNELDTTVVVRVVLC